MADMCVVHNPSDNIYNWFVLEKSIRIGFLFNLSTKFVFDFVFIRFGHRGWVFLFICLFFKTKNHSKWIDIHTTQVRPHKWITWSNVYIQFNIKCESKILFVTAILGTWNKLSVLHPTVLMPNCLCAITSIAIDSFASNCICLDAQSLFAIRLLLTWNTNKRSHPIERIFVTDLYFRSFNSLHFSSVHFSMKCNQQDCNMHNNDFAKAVHLNH